MTESDALLMLADAAAQRQVNDVAVQTEEQQIYNNAAFSPVVVQQNQQPSSSSSSASRTTQLHNVHDYVRGDDFDVLVNDTHDYYRRVAAPEHDSEHSYSFPPLPHTSFNPTDKTDEAFFEDIANLGEFMGLESAEQPSVSEEIVQPDADLCLSSVNSNNDLSDVLELLTQNDNNDTGPGTVIELGDVDFEDILEYLNCDDSETGELSKQTSIPLSDATTASSSISDAIELSCNWLECGWRGVDLAKHVETHLEWPSVNCCAWRNCDRREKFNRRYLLTRHMRRHTSERPFCCWMCGCAFSTRERFVIHLRSHKGQLPYPCAVCGKAFRSTGERSRHSKVHGERTKLSCLQCPKSYSDRDSLRKHVRLKHGQ